MYKKVFLILVSIIILCGCESKNEKVLNVLNWSSYIPDSVIHDFERKYHIKVNYGTYSSNEELLAKVTSSKKGTYDVIFPSDYMIELMIQRNIIEKIDKTKITNLKNINEVFLNQDYDKDNNYSLPFLSTIVVIAVNKDHIKDDIKSYNSLLDRKYKNNIVFLDDQRIVIGIGLLAKGYSMNEIDSFALDESYKFLNNLKSNIKAYDSDSPKTFLITKEADIGVMWNAEAEIAKSENNSIDIIYPSEGHAISTDNYAIVKDAKNLDEAYLFIDYLLNIEVAESIVEEYPYISPLNIKQKSNIDIRDVFANGYYVKNIGQNIKEYDKLWARIK